MWVQLKLRRIEATEESSIVTSHSTMLGESEEGGAAATDMGERPLGSHC